MHRKTRFITFLLVGLITLLAMGTILAKDNKGNGNGNGNNPDPVVDSGNGDNGNHHGGGNNGNGGGNGGGNGNGGEQPAPAPATEVQPTQPPAPAPQTSDGLLGCQKNNPSRLDCSSLEVSGVCQDGVAVFTIRNTGEAGNGDMRAATQYRIVVDGVVVETGSIQLAGNTTTQITYSGGGTVTLEADQQVGHPGNSHPRVTLDCAPATETSTPEPTQEVTPTPDPTEEVTPTVEPTVEAPVLSAEAFCKEDGSILFIVSNSGGNMPEASYYTVTDGNGSQIDSGWLQLFAGEDFPLQYWGHTVLTLQIGDLIVTSPECVPTTAVPTEEVTPTVEPTIEAPVLSAEVLCQENGSVLFLVTNTGGNMLESAYYTVTDANGDQIDSGWVQIFTGEVYPLQYWYYSVLTLQIGDLLVVASPECVPTTAEPTPEVTPPPIDPPALSGNVSCLDDGSILFNITNSGGNMQEASYFTITDSSGGLVADGWLQIFTGEVVTLQYWGYPQLTFTMGDLVITQDAECIPPTPTPTEEVTPTPDPTEEVTPTPEPTAEVTPTPDPTQEVTPTVEPTETVTPPPDGPLGCQKNNPERLDCSSLQVSGTCQDGVAVFTIRNMGKRGEGDMRASTEYRIIVDGVVVESGSVQLVGGAATQITYSGSGKVTLEADQQVGHPGNSQPQATVSCSA